MLAQCLVAALVMVAAGAFGWYLDARLKITNPPLYFVFGSLATTLAYLVAGAIGG